MGVELTEFGESKEVALDENEGSVGIGPLMSGWDKKKNGPKKVSDGQRERGVRGVVKDLK